MKFNVKKKIMLNLIKSNIKDKSKSKLEEEKKSEKHFPSAIREWNNSIYVYNKNALNLIPSTTFTAIKLIKSFFNLYNSTVERKMRTKRLLLRLRRLSLNKIFVSNGEFKHTNNKVTITLYIFNRQKRSYLNRMKKLRFFLFYTKARNNLAKKIIRTSKLKILYFIRKSETNLLNIIKHNQLIKSNGSAIDLGKYVNNFYKKYAKKSYIYIKTFFFYKQLMYINKVKYNYTYLKHLKNFLEKLFNKNVEFNLVNIKRFYLNSDILSESITLKLTKNRRKMLRYMKNIRKKVKINRKNILLIKPVRENIFKESINIDNNLTKKNLVFSALKYKDVTGFRLEARGRLTRRYTASRSVTKIRYKGNLLNMDSSHRGLSTILLKGNLRSNLQYTKLKSKTRIGSFGIKGWVSGN
jgi:Mitochondrial ribosomal protein (VAR1)